jgi:hypothetical protein
MAEGAALSARLKREALARGGETEVVLSHFVAEMDRAAAGRTAR